MQCRWKWWLHIPWTKCFLSQFFFHEKIWLITWNTFISRHFAFRTWGLKRQLTYSAISFRVDIPNPCGDCIPRIYSDFHYWKELSKFKLNYCFVYIIYLKSKYCMSKKLQNIPRKNKEPKGMLLPYLSYKTFELS